MQRIVVVGDVMVDHHLYEGERNSPTMDNKRGVHEVVQLGGARCIVDLLAALGERAKAEQTLAKKKREEAIANGESPSPLKYRFLTGEGDSVSLGIVPPPTQPPICPHHAFAVWRPYPKSGKGDQYAWRASLVMGYGHEPPTPMAPVETQACDSDHFPAPVGSDPPPTILILDDAGYRFRHRDQQMSWLLPAEASAGPEWIVLKMSRPVAQGDLFSTLHKNFADRTICIVAANELRQECIELSKNLSWEQSIEDLESALQSDPLLSRLTAFRHLIVTFGMDGAVWVDHTDRQAPRAWLIAEAGGAEGQFAADIKGDAFGYHSVLVASITRALVEHGESLRSGRSDRLSFLTALAAGLAAKRDLRENGHGEVGKAMPAGFPAARLAAALDGPNGDFARIPLPWPITSGSEGSTSTWRLVESTQHPLGSSWRPSLLGLATQVVINGIDVLKRLPHARFGDLFTADRREIEALRNIRQQMRDFRDSGKSGKPLSIGVFGPPGAGKSFGVREIAKSVFGKEAWLEFNLSQFANTRDLIGAFHRIRDLVLSGLTPVVFWDEFDSKEYEWLQYLLAPMQDGRFQDGQLNHAIGKCVFVFAGGTSATYDDFGPSPFDEAAQRTYRLRKGPDFHSRLDAYYDVLGPNQRRLSNRHEPPTTPPTPAKRDPNDVCFPLRRAILIRAKLKCAANERLDVDSDLIEALLRVGDYKHGARSLEKLVSGLRVGDLPVRRSALPPRNQIAMHVDADEFSRLLRERKVFRAHEAIEPIARAIHETWRALSAEQHWTMQPNYNMPYEQLGEAEKEENRAAARRIPEVVGLIGLTMEAVTAGSQPLPQQQQEVATHLAHHLELLAEAEHDGWSSYRLRNGWRYGKVRDDQQKIHDALKPYAELTEADKEKDRNAVRHFPDMVARASYRLVFLR